MKSLQTKWEIRQNISSLKQEHSPLILHKLSGEILEKLEASQEFREAKRIAIYHALPDEVNTLPLLQRWHPEKQFFLPKVEGDTISFYPYAGEDDLKPGSFGIREPKGKETACTEEIPDLIIIPGVAFDRNLNRIGRGKGYYDRYLLKRDIPKVALCFNFQLIDEIPCDPHDIPMNCIITEKEIIR